MTARELIQALVVLPAQYQDCPVIIAASNRPNFSRQTRSIQIGEVARAEIVKVQGQTVILLSD